MAKTKVKKIKKKVEEKEEDENAGGASLDDAFADDDDVEYAKAKPKKMKKKEIEEELDEVEEELEGIEKGVNGDSTDTISVKASKPVSKIKKGDKIKVDGNEYEVDQHYVLIDHGTTKEMAIELFDKNDKDYQLRYFSDQAEATMEFYELQEIMFIKKRVSKVEW
jgi:hypothetical protein